MGELNCSGKTAKFILAVCNLVVMVAGLAMIGVAIWFVADSKATIILKITESPTSTTRALAGAAGGIVILSGFLLFLVGVIGFCGALRHRTGCLNCFSAILIILIILQVVAAIMAGVFHSQITTGLTNVMTGTMKLYNTTQGFKEAWNFVQCEFSCCGVTNASDWKHVEWKSSSSDGPVPDTCCRLEKHDYVNPKPLNEALCYEDAEKDNAGSYWVYYKGCETKLEDWFSAMLGPVIGVAVGVVVIELVGIILSCLLTARIKSGYEYV